MIAWLRARLARRRHARLLRAAAEANDRLAGQLQTQSDAAWEASRRKPEVSAERMRLECLSHQLACEAMAARYAAGGDDGTAGIHMDAAEWWRQRGLQYAAAERMMEDRANA